LALPPEHFVAAARAYFAKHEVFAKTGLATEPPAAYRDEVFLLSQPKIKGFEELPAYTAYFWTDTYPTDDKAKTKALGKGDPKARLAEILNALPGLDLTSDASVEAGLKALAESKGLGFGDYQAVARVAVTGLSAGPSITAIFRVLGRERVAARLARFGQAV
jgi:glutamyl-tRNA synthetase